MNLLWAIQIPFVSESLAWRFHQMLVAPNLTILDHIVSMALQVTSRERVHIVARDSEGKLRGSGCNILFSPLSSEISLVGELLQRTHADAVLLLSPGNSLIPGSCCEQMIEHHVSNDNDLTEASGFARNWTPAIVSPRLLNFLNKLPGQRDDHTIRGWFHEIKRAASVIGGNGVDLPLRSFEFDFSGRYRTAEVELPCHIRAETRRDVKLALKFIQRGVAARSDVETIRLHEYKMALVARKQRSHAVNQGRSTADLLPSSKPRRILFVANRSAYSGGEESPVRMIAPMIRQSGMEVHALIGRRGVFTDKLIEVGAKVECPEQDFTVPSVPTICLLDKLLCRLQPTIVHLHGACGQAILLAAARKRVPILEHFRNADVPSLGDAVYQATHLICVSEFLADKVCRFDIDASKIRVVYDGIDIRRFEPKVIDKRAARKHFSIKEDARVILNIARITPNKKHDTLLDAFAQVLCQLRNAELYLVGECANAAYGASVKERCRGLGISESVHFLPFQSDIRWIEAAADIQVLCYQNEPLGTSILESMSLGIPVIISDAGGLCEVVRDGTNGFIVPVGDSSVLAERAIRLLANPDLRDTLGREARLTIESRFSSESCAKHILEIYKEITDNTSGGASAATRSRCTGGGNIHTF